MQNVYHRSYIKVFWKTTEQKNAFYFVKEKWSTISDSTMQSFQLSSENFNSIEKQENINITPLIILDTKYCPVLTTFHSS